MELEKIELVEKDYQLEGIKNIEVIKEKLEKRLEKDKGLIVTEETEKDIVKTIKELKAERMVLKSVRATLNKKYQAFAEVQLGKADKLLELYNDVLNPLIDGVEELKEERREYVRKKKIDKFGKIVIDANAVIQDLKKEHIYLDFELIELDEKLLLKADDKVDKYISDKIAEVQEIIKDAGEKKAMVEIFAKSLASEYSLSSDIDISKLKEKLYSESITTLKEILEGYAEEQQVIELNAVIKEEERKKEQEEREEQQRLEKELKEKKEKKVVDISAKERKIRIDVVIRSNRDLVIELEECLVDNYKVEKINIKEF